jgi:hypothetical protein
MIRPYDDGKVIIKTILTIAFILFIIGYGLYQAKNLIYGPKINISSELAQNYTTNNELFDIGGKTQNINSISLNDREIKIDESGSFDEKLLLFPGYNVIKLLGKDKFGRAVEKKIEVVYKP